MSIELWLAFVTTSAVLLVIPGPTILTVISYSMAHGRSANIPIIAAIATCPRHGVWALLARRPA